MNSNVNGSLRNNRYATQSHNLASKKLSPIEKTELLRIKNYEEKASFIWGLKSQVGCKECGIDDYRILEFHHTNHKQRKFNLGLSCSLRSWESILKEISKCKILCSNCHRLEEFKKKTKILLKNKSK